MPEQNTPVPIKREDIRTGDRIRSTHEFTAGNDWLPMADDASTYELVARAVLLPTEHGVYLDKDGDVRRLDEDGLWRITDFKDEGLAAYAPFTLLRPVHEVAAEIADWMDSAEWSWGKLNPVLTNAIRKHFGVTS